MKKENFKNILKSYYDISVHISDLYDIGFNLSDNKRFPINDLISNMFSQSILSHYNDEGLDWVTWYLFEFNKVHALSSDDELMYPDREPAAWDSKGSPICFNIDALYDYINENCKPEKQECC